MSESASASQRYSYDLEESTDFNPFEDFNFVESVDEDEDIIEGTLDDGPYSTPNPDNAPQFKAYSFENAETATERIETLFSQMMVHSDIMLDILGSCAAPYLSDDLVQHVAELQENHHSVYTPLTFCRLLERAGAIEQTTEDGTSLKDVVVEPNKVVEDGIEYWVVAPAPPIYWLNTPEGQAYYDAYNPIEMLRAVCEAEPQYQEIVRTILNLTAKEGGIDIKDIDDVIEDDPILQSPRRYPMYFIDKLERAGGVKWSQKWAITDAGRQFLEELE